MAFVAASIASGLVVTTFGTWQGGGAWGFLVFAALACVIREWESKDEGYVIVYEDADKTDEESEDAVEKDEESEDAVKADEESEGAVEEDEESNLVGKK